jgi:hypothetical protein
MLSAQKIFLILGVFLLIVELIAGTPVVQVVFQNPNNLKIRLSLVNKENTND